MKYIILLLAGIALYAPQARAQKTNAATITYISAEAIYINAGTNSGIQVGDSLVIRRGKKTIGVVIIKHVSSQSSAGELAGKESTVKVGDSVILASGRTLPPSNKAAVSDRAAASSKKSRSSRSESGVNKLRGSIVFQNHFHKDMTGSGLTWQRPGLQTRIAIANLGGSGVTFQMRHRSRLYHRSRAISIGQSRNEWTHQLYEFSFLSEDETSGETWGAGRILAPDVRGMGYIDGGYFSKRVSPHYRVGIAAGTVPDIQTSGYDFDRRKVGFFGSYESGTYEKQHISVSGAFSAEYELNNLSREFLYLQSVYTRASKLTVYQSVEVDYNRSWRFARTGDRFTFTNYYGTLNYTISSNARLNFSYDARKNILRFEQRNLADSLFDNTTHQGVKAGFSIRLKKRFSIRGNAGIRFRQGLASNNKFYSFGIRAAQFPRRRHSISLNISIIESAFTTGYRPALTYRFPVTRRILLNLSGSAYIYKTGNNTIRNFFLEASSSYSFARRYYLSGGLRQFIDKHLQSTELYTELGVRL